MKVIIIIPTYNEKGNIDRLIPMLENDIFPTIEKKGKYTMHILIADDSSPDGTSDEVRKLMKKWKNIDLTVGQKQGLGAAYVRGMDYALDSMKADVMFEMDADLSHDPKKIPEFLEKIDEGYDLIIGARYIKGGSIPKNWGLHRKAFSVFGNLLVRAILGRFWHHDFTTGFRAIRKEVFVKLRPELTAFRGYTFQVSFLHKAMVHGFKVAEIPFNFVDRTLGKSKIAPKEYIFDLLKYVCVARFYELLHTPFPKYAITGFSGYLINAISLEIFYQAGFTPAVAGAIGSELSIIWNFILNNFWAFKSYKITTLNKLPFKFLQFNTFAFGSVVIISVAEAIGTRAFGENARHIILILAIGFLVIPYSYTMYNIFIWKRWRPQIFRKLQEILG